MSVLGEREACGVCVLGERVRRHVVALQRGERRPAAERLDAMSVLSLTRGQHVDDSQDRAFAVEA